MKRYITRKLICILTLNNKLCLRGRYFCKFEFKTACKVLEIEVVIFVVISLATLLALRPVLRRYFKRNNYNTNIDSFTGKRGYVIEDIEYLKPGAVKIGDVSWTAIPVEKGQKILENEIIEVVAINGNKLIVKKVEEK